MQARGGHISPRGRQKRLRRKGRLRSRLPGLSLYRWHATKGATKRLESERQAQRLCAQVAASSSHERECLRGVWPVRKGMSREGNHSRTSLKPSTRRFRRVLAGAAQLTPNPARGTARRGKRALTRRRASGFNQGESSGPLAPHETICHPISNRRCLPLRKPG